MTYIIFQYAPSEDIDYEKKDIKEHLDYMFSKDGYASGYLILKESVDLIEIIKRLKNELIERNIQLKEYDRFSVNGTDEKERFFYLITYKMLEDYGC